MSDEDDGTKRRIDLSMITLCARIHLYKLVCIFLLDDYGDGGRNRLHRLAKSPTATPQKVKKKLPRSSEKSVGALEPFESPKTSKSSKSSRKRKTKKKKKLQENDEQISGNIHKVSSFLVDEEDENAMDQDEGVQGVVDTPDENDNDNIDDTLQGDDEMHENDNNNDNDNGNIIEVEIDQSSSQDSSSGSDSQSEDADKTTTKKDSKSMRKAEKERKEEEMEDENRSKEDVTLDLIEEDKERDTYKDNERLQDDDMDVICVCEDGTELTKGDLNASDCNNWVCCITF